MESLEQKITSLIEEHKAIEDLSYEVEKVLHYYQEHPQYPLDYDKIRKRMKEVSLRLSKLTGQMEQLLHSEEKA
ncbi:MAG: hypothetical protein ACOYNS_04890 [Bacteroidota bacterium]